jgi:hypothetical protein
MIFQNISAGSTSRVQVAIPLITRISWTVQSGTLIILVENTVSPFLWKTLELSPGDYDEVNRMLSSSRRV